MANIIPNNFSLRRNPINVEITQSLGNDVVVVNGATLRPEAFNGDVCVDVSALLSHPEQDIFVTDFQIPVGQSFGYRTAYKDKHLVFPTTLTVNGTVYKRTYLEGFNYVGETSSPQPNIFTNFGKIHCWSGFPRPVAMPYNKDYKIGFDDYSITATTVVQDVTQIVLDVEELAQYQIVLDDGTTTAYFPVVRHQAPEHPFYVRWVNRQGGWDCWMFECNQSDEIATKSSTIRKWSTTNVDAMEALETIDATIERSIGVIAGQLSQEDFKVIRELGTSPCIQVYANPEITSHLFGNIEGWLTIGCQQTSSSIKVASVRNDIEFTFQIPTI